jgi:AcrR family transcriptional regulator
VNVSEAARRAGVSGGAPYRHFKDREDLLVSVARSAYVRLWERLQQAVAREADPEAKFIAIIDESYRYFADEPAATELLFHSGITIAHRELDPMSHAAFDVMMEIARSIAPAATKSERKDFVMAFVGLCYGSGRMRRDHFSPVSRPEDYPEIGKRGTALLIEGFKARSRKGGR